MGNDMLFKLGNYTVRASQPYKSAGKKNLDRARKTSRGVRLQCSLLQINPSPNRAADISETQAW